MEQMRNLLRPSTSHTAAEGSPSELSTPRSSLSSSHRTTPSFNDLSFGASSDGKAVRRAAIGPDAAMSLLSTC